MQLLLVAGMFGFLFFSTLYLRQSLGYNALHTGLGMIPVAVAIGAVSLGFSANLIGRFGPKPILGGGLLLITAGLALLGRVPIDGSFLADVLPAMLVIGVGFGAAMPALIGLGMSGTTEADSGLASAMFNTSQQIGGALGLSVLAALAADRSDSLRAAGTENLAALTAGYHTAFFVAAGFAFVAFIVAMSVLSARSTG